MFKFFKNNQSKQNKDIKSHENRILNISYFISFLCYRPYSSDEYLTQYDLTQKYNLFKSRWLLRNKRINAFNHFTDVQLSTKLYSFFNYVSVNELLYDLKKALSLFVEDYDYFFTEKEIVKLNIIFDYIDMQYKDKDDYTFYRYDIFIQRILKSNKYQLATISAEFYLDNLALNNKKSKKKKFLNNIVILFISSLLVYFFI